MDRLSPAQRKKTMQHIRSKDTTIETMLRKALWSAGIRYRKNYAALPGKPDIAITKSKIAVFCDGEFFHGKDWEHLKDRLTKTANHDYWIKKISRTIERDKENDQKLRYLGWTVLHFWGDEIKKDVDGCVQTIKEAIFYSSINTPGDILPYGDDEDYKGKENG